MQSPVSADNDQCIQPEKFYILDDLIRYINNDFLAVPNDLSCKGIAAIGCSENGPSARQNSADFIMTKGNHATRFEETVVAVFYLPVPRSRIR